MLDPNGALVAHILAEFRTNPCVAGRWRVLIVPHRRKCSFNLSYRVLSSKIQFPEDSELFLYRKAHEDITTLFHERNFPFFLPF